MTTATDTLIPLTLEEADALFETARSHDAVFRRGRMVLEYDVTEAGRAEAVFPIAPTTCKRIHYQWDENGCWQAMAWDAEGRCLSDTACDGTWIEAGGSLWSRRYDDEFDDWEEDEEETSVSLRDEREDSLRKELWARELATMHQSSRHLFGILAQIRGRSPRGYLARPLFREEISGDVVYQCQDRDFGPLGIDSDISTRIRWWWKRLCQPWSVVQTLCGRPVYPVRSDIRMHFDPVRACYRNAYCLFEQGKPVQSTVDIWDDVLPVSESVYVPRTRCWQRSLTDPTVLASTTLDMANCAFGDDAELAIRAVNLDLPRVE